MDNLVQKVAGKLCSETYFIPDCRRFWPITRGEKHTCRSGNLDIEPFQVVVKIVDSTKNNGYMGKQLLALKARHVVIRSD